MYLQNSSKPQQITARSQIMHKTLSSTTIFWSSQQKTPKFPQKTEQIFQQSTDPLAVIIKETVCFVFGL